MLVAANPLIQIIPGLMIWTIVAFAITLWVLKRYAFGPVQKLIDDRRDRIRQSIEEADRAREEARRLLEEHRALIGQAKGQAEEILAEARKVADAQRERLRGELEEDRQRRLDETQRQIEQATAQALGDIRREVASLSLLAAEKITRKTLTDADQQRLIDEALSEIDRGVALTRDDPNVNRAVIGFCSYAWSLMLRAHILVEAGRLDEAKVAYVTGGEVAARNGDLQTKKEIEVFLRRLDARAR